MSVPARMAGIPEGGVGDDRLIKALSLGRNNMQELVSIANGAPPKNGVDSMYAVIALNLLKPIKQAQQERQAQQPKQPSVKDQVVAEAAPHAQMSGLAAADAGEMMTPKALAAGGIVAFGEGGDVPHFDGTAGSLVNGSLEDLTAQISALRQQRLQLENQPYSTAGATPGIGTGIFGGFTNPKQQRINELDAKIATLEKQYGEAKGRYDRYAVDRKAVLSGEPQFDATPATTTTPGAAGTPGGPSATKPDAGLPLLAVDSGVAVPRGNLGDTSGTGIFNTFKALATKAGKDIKDVNIGEIAKQAEKDPELSKRFGFTAEQYEKQFAKPLEILKGQIPESEAAERKKIQEREAGLEALSTKREQRAGEAYARAEKESGIGKGEALMALAGTLVSTPRNDPRFSAGITNFTSMLGSVRKDLSKAAGERDKALDLIEESRELRKVGQFEKAEANYKEGQRRLFDFTNTVKQGAIASDIARNSNILNYAGTEANKNIKAIETQLSTLTAGLKEAEATRRTGMEIENRAQVAAMQDKTNREIANLEARVKQNVYELAYGSKEARAINDALDTASKAFKNLAEKNLKLASDPVAASNEFRNQQQIALRAAGLDDAKIKQILGAPSGGGATSGPKVLGPES